MNYHWILLTWQSPLYCVKSWRQFLWNHKTTNLIRMWKIWREILAHFIISRESNNRNLYTQAQVPAILLHAVRIKLVVSRVVWSDWSRNWWSDKSLAITHYTRLHELHHHHFLLTANRKLMLRNRELVVIARWHQLILTRAAFSYESHLLHNFSFCRGNDSRLQVKYRQFSSTSHHFSH